MQGRIISLHAPPPPPPHSTGHKSATGFRIGGKAPATCEQLAVARVPPSLALKGHIISLIVAKFRAVSAVVWKGSRCMGHRNGNSWRTLDLGPSNMRSGLHTANKLLTVLLLRAPCVELCRTAFSQRQGWAVHLLQNMDYAVLRNAQAPCA